MLNKSPDLRFEYIISWWPLVHMNKIESTIYINAFILIRQTVHVLFRGPFHQKAYACRNSTTVVNIDVSQIFGLSSVSSNGVTYD